MNRRNPAALAALAALATVLLMSACEGDPPPTPEATDVAAPTLPALATNAFYYYRDVEAAWAFYQDVLGLETAADFGFAKIMRVAPASYVTLVDEERGMHSSAEPKSVTLALVTEQVEAWHEYLLEAGVPLMGAFTVTEGRPHDGFVAVDPEGYLLEFERFNPHEENTELIPVLDGIEALGPAPGTRSSRPEELRIQATVLWLYYRDISAALAWYEETLGTRLIVDQGWAKVVPVSATGFLGFVDGERGLHQATDEKAVTVSFFEDDVEPWFERLLARQDFRFRSEEIGDESGRVRTFVGYDPEGYFLEWDTFLDVGGNERLLRQLEGR